MVSAKQKVEDKKLRQLEHRMKRQLQHALADLLQKEGQWEGSIKAFGTVSVSLRACRPVCSKPKFANIRTVGELLSEDRIKGLGYSHAQWRQMYSSILNEGWDDDTPIETILQRYADGGFRRIPNAGEKTLAHLNQVLQDCGYNPLP